MRKEKTIANCKEGGFNNNNNSNWSEKKEFKRKQL
jgi:hypothetical protein